MFWLKQNSIFLKAKMMEICRNSNTAFWLRLLLSHFDIVVYPNLGRPRFGWMDGVKRALNDRRMDMREANERARNRNEWRMIVTQF